MRFQNLEDSNKYNEEELKGKQYNSIKQESDITQKKNLIEDLRKEREVINENFTNYIKNANMLEEDYKNTITDIDQKLKNMDSFNKYKYIDIENLLDTTNYQFGSEIKDITNNHNTTNQEDDKYMSYNEEEITKYNYINDIDDLNQVIKGYKLEKYIQIKDNLLDINIDIQKLNQQTLDEIRNANIHDFGIFIELTIWSLDKSRILFENPCL